MAPPVDNLHQRCASQERLDQLVERGRLLMQALANRAEVAKLEAERAELQIALEDARAGRPARLQHLVSKLDGQEWPAQIREFQDLPETPRETSVGIAATQDSSPDQSEQLSIDVNSWESLLQHSRRRLESRQVNRLEQTDNKAPTAPLSQTSNSISINRSSIAAEIDPAPPVSEPNELTSPQTTPAQRTVAAKEGKNVGRRKAVAPLPQANCKTPLKSAKARRKSTEPACVKVADAASSASISQVTPIKSPFKRLGGGLGLSTIVHALIVFFLAVYHLRAPETIAGLAFESSPVDTPADVFEVSQPSEVAEPADEPVTEPLNNESQDLEQVLSEASNLVLDSALTTNQESSTSMLTDSSVASQSAELISSTSASFFGVATGGNNFCYVVDTSGSMRGQPWEAAKRELLRSLSSLKATQRFYIIFVGEDFAAIPAPGGREPSTHLLYANSENLEHARRWIESTKVGSGSPPTDALEFAISKEPDAIYLLTDGVTKVDVCAFLRKVNRFDDVISGERVRVPIHAIAFFSLAGQDLMRRIASENQGQFIYVPNPRKK